MGYLFGSKLNFLSKIDRCEGDSLAVFDVPRMLAFLPPESSAFLSLNRKCQNSRSDFCKDSVFATQG